MSSNIRILTFCFSIIFLVNCSEKADTTSSIEINFQSKGVSASAINKSDLDVIIINVSGPGIEQTIVAHKNCDNGDDCSKISIDGIPSGSARLIQMLIVTKEGETTLSNAIFYGDSTNDISGNTPVSINLKQEDSFSNEADIQGQYIPKVGHALAGKELSGSVDVRVSIAGKPDMTLGRTSIMGGWFNFFLLDTVKFKYFFSGWDFSKAKYNNVEIFNDIHDGHGMSIDTITPLATANNNKVASFKPNSIINVRENRENDTYELRRLEQKIIAFLGGSQKHVCYDPTAVTNFDGNTGSYICIDQDITPGAANTCDTYLAWTQLEKSLSVGSATCDSDPGEWEVDTKKLNEKDRFSGFHGLFTNNGTAGNLAVNYTSASRTFSWKIDSKVSVNGIHVLTKSTSSFDRDKFKTKDLGDSYDCKKAVESGDFSSPISAQISPTSGDYEYQISTTQEADKNNNQFYMLLCPLAPDGTYYDSAYLYDNNHNSDQAGPPEKARIRKAQAIDGFSGKLYVNTCYPFEVELIDSQDNSTHVSSPVTVTLNDSSSNGDFFNNHSECVGDSNQLSSINLSDRKVIYYKNPTSGVSAQLSTNSASLSANGFFDYTPMSIPASNRIQLVPSFSREHTSLNVASTETCVPFMIGAFHFDGTDTELIQFQSASADISQLSQVSPGDRSFFSSKADCEAGSPTLTSATGTTESLIEVWYKNIDSSPTTISDALMSCSGAICPATSINVISPGSYNHFHVDILTVGSFSPSSCVELKIGAYDDHKPNSYPTNFVNSNPITFSDIGSAGGSFYTTAGCGVGQASPISAPIGLTSGTIYYKAATDGTAQLRFNYDGQAKELDITINP